MVHTPSAALLLGLLLLLLLTSPSVADFTSNPPPEPETITITNQGSLDLLQDPNYHKITISATSSKGGEIEWTLEGDGEKYVKMATTSGQSPSSLEIELDPNRSAWPYWAQNSHLVVRAKLKNATSTSDTKQISLTKFRRGNQVAPGSGNVTLTLGNGGAGMGYTFDSGSTSWSSQTMTVAANETMMNGTGTGTHQENFSKNAWVKVYYNANGSDKGGARDYDVDFNLSFTGSLTHTGTNHEEYDNTTVDMGTAVSAGIDFDGTLSGVGFPSNTMGDGYRGAAPRSLTVGISAQGGLSSTGPSGGVGASIGIPIVIGTSYSIANSRTPGATRAIGIPGTNNVHLVAHTLNPKWMIHLAASTHTSQTIDDDWDLHAEAVVNCTVPTNLSLTFEPAL